MQSRYARLTPALVSFLVIGSFTGLWGQGNEGLQPARSFTAPDGAKPNITAEMRGDIYMARKMFREAIDVYKQAPQGSPIIANKLGIAYHQLLDLNSAKKNYEAAIKLRRNFAEAINNLGTVFYAQKNYRRAVNQYRKALIINPNSASIHSNLGTAYFARRKYAEAMKEYEAALALDPEVFEHRGSQGVLLQERSVEERAKFHFYLAKTYAKAGQTERALLYMRKCLEEGFNERQKFVEEKEFAALQTNEEFLALLKLEPVKL